MAPPSDQGVDAPPLNQHRNTSLSQPFESPELSETSMAEMPPPLSFSDTSQAPEVVDKSKQNIREDPGPGGPSLGAGLKETAQTAADAVRQQAAQFAQDVSDELSKTGEAQKARGADAIRQFARAIDSAANELESQSPTIARAVHGTARQVENLSDNLSRRSVNELIESAAQLARTQPALFVGGSLAAGFALARFLKSSSRQRSGAGSDAYQQ
jgi:gas vesicle protein